MARNKPNRNSSGRKSSSPSGRGGQTLLPRARVLLVLVVVGLLGWGMRSVWQRVAPAVIQQEHHLLAAERITATQCPEWITTDVCDEVVRDAGQRGGFVRSAIPPLDSKQKVS